MLILNENLLERVDVIVYDFLSEVINPFFYGL